MRVGALPQYDGTELAELFAALDDRRDVVPGQHACLARELRRAVREENLHLADAARVEQQLAWPWIRGRVLRTDPDVERAERDPAGFAAPARVDQLALQREQSSERGDGLGRRTVLEPRLESRAAGLDLEHSRNLP